MGGRGGGEGQWPDNGEGKLVQWKGGTRRLNQQKMTEIWLKDREEEAAAGGCWAEHCRASGSSQAFRKHSRVSFDSARTAPWICQLWANTEPVIKTGLIKAAWTLSAEWHEPAAH